MVHSIGICVYVFMALASLTYVKTTASSLGSRYGKDFPYSKGVDFQNSLIFCMSIVLRTLIPSAFISSRAF
jgi:hypothetical protein